MSLGIVAIGIGIVGVIICRAKESKALQKSFLVLTGVGVVIFFVSYAQSDNAESDNTEWLIRQPVGEGAYETELILQVEGLEERRFLVSVPEQILSTEEECAYLEAAVSEIEAEVKGKNPSFNYIQKQLIIKESYQDGIVQAQWNFSHPELIADNGEIQENLLDEEGKLICAEVLLVCGESSLLHSFSFHIYSANKSDEEKLDEKIYAIISDNGKDAGTRILQLPTEVEGRTLSWKKKKSYLLEQILALGILFAVLLPELEKEKERERRKKREAQMLQEYPEMVNKLTLLLRAGMSVQGAWNKITDMYLAARKEGKIPRNEVYEEMLVTRHEIENGRGELRAYEAFGERCGLTRFRKFTNYLVQNVKKGSHRICEILEKEALEVFLEKKNRAKRYGEEATTKLLLPMLLMLGIVIFIIMVPAIISFQVGM